MRLRGMMQNDTSDCGAACLGTICKHYGYENNLGFFREHARTDVDGTSIYGILQCAAYVGLEAEALSGTWEEFSNEMSEEQFPLIAHMAVEGSFFHYIVVKKIRGGKVYIFDPARGDRTLRESEFIREWTGYIITFTEGRSFRKRKERKAYSRYLALLLAYRPYLPVIVGASLLLTAVVIFATMTYKSIIDEFVLKSGAESFYGLFQKMSTIFLMLIGIYILQLALYMVRGYFIASMTKKMHESLLDTFFEKCLKLPLGFFATRKRGEVLNRFNLVNELIGVISNSFITAVMESILIIASIITLFLVNARMSVIVVFIGVLYICCILLFRAPIKENSRDIAENEAKILAYYEDTITNIEMIKAYTNETDRKQKFERLITGYVKSVLKGSRLYVKKSGIEAGINNIGYIIIFWVGAFFVMQGILSLGSLIVYQSLIMYFLDPVGNLAELQQTAQTIKVSCSRINDVLDAEPEPANGTNNQIAFEKVEFSHVRFGYGLYEDILTDINLKFCQGEKIGIIGPSGCGKSTFVQLLLKFYCVREGSLRIDGVDIEDVDTEYLREHITYITQEPYFFTETLRDNLLLGRRGITDGEIIDMLRTCQLEDLVFRLPMGLDTVLSADGGNMSVGERQRMMLARALLRKPKILIADECTSNLDLATEKKIWEELRKYSGDMTFIVISHGRNPISFCDRVYEMREGRLYESDLASDQKVFPAE